MTLTTSSLMNHLSPHQTRSPGTEADKDERHIHLDIAGIVFRVIGGSGASLAWIKERYRTFLSDKPPLISIEIEVQPTWPKGRPPLPRVDWHHSQFQIKMAASRAEGDLGSRQVRLFVPPGPAALSPSFLRLLCSLLLLGEGGVLLHASGVVQNHHAWVFCGPSGSGKTTIARLAGERLVLNDETIAILKRPRTYMACATPFFGEGGASMALVNTQAPLKGLCFLRKAAQFSHRQLTAREAVERACSQVFLPRKNYAVVEGILGNLAGVAEGVPCYDLFFPPSPTLWEYLDGITSDLSVPETGAVEGP